MKTFLTAAILSLLTAAAATATSFVRVSDADLTAQAAIVAEVSVVASGPGATTRPATDYLVEVEKVWKGDAPSGRLVVRVPGGVGADGLGLKIWGAPQFGNGERALLFLTPERDGAYGILHLMLGAFHIAGQTGQEAAQRDLSEAVELNRDGSPVTGSPDAPRDLERFTHWIAASAAHAANPPADYLVPAERGLRAAGAPFVQLAGGDGVPIRWFIFDTGGHVNWKIDPAGQPGLGPDASTAAFQSAIAAWNDDPTSNINYVFSGTSRATAGLTGSDGVNNLLFNDPGNASVPGAFTCAAGGVLAMSGPYYYADTRLFHGRSYHEAFEADIITNDGTQCFFQNNPTGAAAVFGHELGHTLGLGHSADPEALMWAVAHNDGRGAKLGDDDRLAVNLVYGDGTLKIAPPPPPPAPAPATGAPMVVTATAASRTEIDLAWTGGAAADGFVVQVKSGRQFRTMMTLPGTAGAVAVHGLAANHTYVFRLQVRHGSTLTPCPSLVSARTSR